MMLVTLVTECFHCTALEDHEADFHHPSSENRALCFKGSHFLLFLVFFVSFFFWGCDSFDHHLFVFARSVGLVRLVLNFPNGSEFNQNRS